MVVKV
jgi:hypothetical protein